MHTITLSVNNYAKDINTKRQSNRNPFFDLLKVWAIILVIVQHMIAACGYGLDMMNTPPGKVICMFNMPLFVGITGYFFQSTLPYNFSDYN